MIDLVDEIQKNYKFLTVPVPNLEVGEYLIKKYYLTEDSKFTKIVYLDTDLGLYQTKSRILIGSLYGVVGRILDTAIANNELVKVEIVNKRSVKGYMSLDFRMM